MNSQLKITDKDAITLSQSESIEEIQQRKLAEFSFDGLSLDTDSKQNASAAKQQPSQEDTLNQFDLSALSLDAIEPLEDRSHEEETIALEDTPTKTIFIPPKAELDAQSDAQKEALENFDLGKFGLIDKDNSEKKAKKETAKEYEGEEKRLTDRRNKHDRRAQARFDGSERRSGADRRTADASPWSKGYQL